jgi:hypothetical protein
LQVDAQGGKVLFAQEDFGRDAAFDGLFATGGFGFDGSFYFIEDAKALFERLRHLLGPAQPVAKLANGSGRSVKCWVGPNEIIATYSEVRSQWRLRAREHGSKHQHLSPELAKYARV